MSLLENNKVTHKENEIGKRDENLYEECIAAKRRRELDTHIAEQSSLDLKEDGIAFNIGQCPIT